MSTLNPGAQSETVAHNRKRCDVSGGLHIRRRVARDTIRQEVARARDDLHREAARLSTELAEEIIRKNVNDDDRKRLVDGYLREMEGAP